MAARHMAAGMKRVTPPGCGALGTACARLRRLSYGIFMIK